MGFFEVSKPARRRRDLAAELPTEHPAVLDEIDALIDQIPDPDLLHAETRAGSLAKLSRLRNRIDSVICELAASADEHADSRVLDAGTTGTLVAAATVANPQAGSATVARGNALQHLPAVRAGFAAGTISSAHVAVIVAEAPRIVRWAGIEAAVVTLAEQVEPAELARVLKLLADQDQPEALDDTAEVLSYQLDKLAAGEVTFAALREAKLVPAKAKRAKIVKKGELTKAFVLKGVLATAGAKAAIEAAGGSVQE